jgi:hypothetical protein
MRGLSAGGTVLLLLLAGCAAPPPAAFDPPPLAPAFTHIWGSPLTGALPVVGELPEEHEPGRALALAARVAAVPELPAAGLVRLASRAGLVVGAEGDRSLRGWSRLSEGALLGEGAAAARLLAALDEGALPSAGATELTTALLTGTTAVFELPAPLADFAAPPLRVLVTRGATLVVALALQGEVRPLDVDDTGPRSRLELVVLQPPLPADGTPLLLAVPLELPGRSRSTLLVALSAREPLPGDARHAEAVAVAARDARLNSDRRRASAARLTADESFLRQVLSATEALRTPAARRPALIFLADAAGAPLAGDLALLADDAQLADLAARLEAGGRDVPALVAGGGGLAWLLERSALEVLATRATESALPPELAAVLLRHAGEAGRYPGALLDAAAHNTSVAGLAAQLVAENRIALEDSTAAARVRAFDWLAARGAAPPGFDPLAPLSQRRAVLARAEELAAAAAAGAAGAGSAP